MEHIYSGSIELRDLNLESRMIYGKALSFGIDSKILCSEDRSVYFIERLLPGCITLDLIDSANVILSFEHEDMLILGRSNKNEGTLKLELREDGLYFSCDVPKTTLGNDMLELIRRKDLSECSFKFLVSDEDCVWTRSEIPGVLHRDIRKITDLLDCSIVTTPAYSNTFVEARSAELRNAEQVLAEEENEKTEENEEIVEQSEQNEENEIVSENSEINKEEENTSKEKRNLKHKYMKKNISLVQLIRNAMENGEKRFNVSLEKRIMTFNEKNVATEENPDAKDPYYTADTVVEHEYEGLIEPLYNNQVLRGLGIRVMSGAPRGIVTIPFIGKGTVGWANEIAKAVESGNTTSNITMAPKRICAFVDISKQALLTDTLGVNEAIKRDLYNAIADAVQNSMLDNVAGSEVRPAGLLNGLESAGTITKFEDLCNLEAALEDVNFSNVQYLVSNKAYAKLRCLPKSTKTTELVLQNGNIDGVPVTKTGALSGNTIVLGDFSQVALVIWQDAEIVMDEVSHAAEGFVRLVINMYVDFKAVRPEAFKVATI